MVIHIIFIIAGLAILIVGGEFLVKGAVSVAAKAKLSTLVIGMTVVSFGTSAPELFVSLKAAYLDSPEFAIGNIVGSNIANLALVLGLTVIIFPMPVKRNSILFDWPMMMISGLLFWLFSRNLLLERWEGFVLFFLLIAFIYFLISSSRRKIKNQKTLEPDALSDVSKKSVKKTKWWVTSFQLVAGFLGLYLGARWLIDGAIGVGEELSISKHVMAITVLAFGTSVPELVTSVVAAYRKQMDISVGNLIGSNIFNIMAVLGITAIVQPIPVEKNVLQFDMWWMLAVFLVILPMMVISRKIGRISGVILLSSYILYIYLLF